MNSRPSASERSETADCLINKIQVLDDVVTDNQIKTRLPHRQGGSERPRVRDVGDQELALPSWELAVAEDWLGKWAMNLMLIDVSTRKFRRAARLPEGDVPAVEVGSFAALRGVVGCARNGWVRIRPASTSWWCRSTASTSVSIVLVAALGIDSEAFRHPLELTVGGNRAQCCAGIDRRLIERGLDPAGPRLSSTARTHSPRRSGITSGATRRSRAARSTLNIMERRSPALHASVRRALRQAGLETRGGGGEKTDPQSRPAPRARRPWRLKKHPRGIG
jgi:putative transposase